MAAFVIGVMARAPVAGRCKTRLARTMGDEAAARLYEAMLRDTLDAIAGIDARRVIVADPANDGVASLRAMAPSGFEVIAQEAGGLGERLHAAARELWKGSPVVLVGSDAPLAPYGEIAKLIGHQTSGDWALAGPADDGGYWAIALSSPLRAPFEAIAWSTPEVLAQTRARCEAAGVRFGLLPDAYDLDEPADVERAARDLAASPERAIRTARVLADQASGASPSGDASTTV